MSALRIRHAVPADREAVAALLRGLSSESAYRRFQTALGHGPTAAVLDALLPQGRDGGAVLAHVGPRLVGHGVWRRAGATPVAEIGVVVADAEQRRGIGSALADVLLTDLALQGVDRVEVFATATNDAVRRMVEVRAPDAVRVHEGPTVSYTLAVRPVRASSVA